MADMTDSSPIDPATDSGTGSRSPVAWLLDALSSIRLGVVLLSLLFIYSSIGSAFPPIRQMRGLEMTEFEWFCWWPFNALIALLVLNMCVATIRRIPLSTVTAGVWMIHSGILILAIGSVWYFTGKVEGDAIVPRRQVVVNLPGAEPVSMLVKPGAQARVGDYMLSVFDIDPNWEILSGDDAGKRVYKVGVRVETADRMFIRQLLDGFPQYTEDVVRSDDPAQPMARAIKVFGTRTLDDPIELALETAPVEHFFVKDTVALFLREAGTTEWIERPIEGLPRYHDHVSAAGRVWGDETPRDALNIDAPPVAANDPCPNMTFRVTDYLRYAFMEEGFSDGGQALNPAVQFTLSSTRGQKQTHELYAMDPARNNASGVIDFRVIERESELAGLQVVAAPALRIEVPGASVTLEHAIEETVFINEDAPFIDIEGTEYSFRVQGLQDQLTVGEITVNIAFVEIKRGDEYFLRWVSDDPQLDRDLPMSGSAGHAGELEFDDGIAMRYAPGRMPAPVTLVSGPRPSDLRIMLATGGAEMTVTDLPVGRPVPIRETISLIVHRYAPRAVMGVKPRIVPYEQQQRDFGVQFSMIRLASPTGDATWLPYHLYAFESAGVTPRRYVYQPTTVVLPDGRAIELMFSRRRAELGTAVRLEDFEIQSHIGGFSGANSSVLDWISKVRFGEGDGSEVKSVRVNGPVRHGEYWYFQSGWDPPEGPQFAGDPGSSGLNYTILGVGNRHGVMIQLIGCCIAAVGMIYAFYIKPIIKRKRMAALEVEPQEVAAAAEVAP